MPFNLAVNALMPARCSELFKVGEALQRPGEEKLLGNVKSSSFAEIKQHIYSNIILLRKEVKACQDFAAKALSNIVIVCHSHSLNMTI